MRHLAVPYHLAHHRADGGTFLGHGHVVDVVVEHGQQLTHQVKFHPRQNALVCKAFQFPDAGAQGGILTVQLLNALFQVDCGGAVSKIGKGVDESSDLPLRLGPLFAQGGKLGLKLGAVACVGRDFRVSLYLTSSLLKVKRSVGKVRFGVRNGKGRSLPYRRPSDEVGRTTTTYRRNLKFRFRVRTYRLPGT